MSELELEVFEQSSDYSELRLSAAKGLRRPVAWTGRRSTI